MHITVLVGVFHVGKGLSTVRRLLHCGAYQIEPVKVVRAGEDLLIIMGSCAATNGVRALGPTCTTIIGTPDSTLTTIELDRGVNNI